ncbi:MAG: FkbM family methyltransferase [Crenarchaeota archaeon]|nr:FkbM family methyltransferase [Thermoproteota archaeon]
MKALKFALKTIEPFQDKLDQIWIFKKIFQVFYDKFVPDKWILVETEGIKMYINPRDRAISRFIIQQGSYERGTTKVFKEVIKEGMTFFDVGAHWGYYSLIAASLVGQKGKVFAFEPHPFNYEMLLKTIRLNGFSNIIPVNKAVSDKNGKAVLFCSTSNVGSHSIVLSDGKDRYMEVETITLDDFCEKNNVFPDVVKIDVEGAELKVLKGMSKIIESSRRLILFIEFEYNKKELYKFLSKNFEIYHITGNGKLKRYGSEKLSERIERNIYCRKG